MGTYPSDPPATYIVLSGVRSYGSWAGLVDINSPFVSSSARDAVMIPNFFTPLFSVALVEAGSEPEAALD